MSAIIGPTPRRGWQELPLRRVLVGIEQGWSPVAEERVADDDEWAVLKLSAVKRGKYNEKECKALPGDIKADGRFEVKQGDILLTRANTPELVGDACFVAAASPKRMMSDLIYRLRARGVDERYLVYSLLGSYTRGQITADARGSSQSMVKVSQGHIRSWTVLLPEQYEQRAIADFLDRKTAAVDALIEKKERLIALLQEKRQALITQAVTKGLDPSAPMKDSGVEWLGEIPAHWEVLPTRRLCKLTTGGRDTQDALDDGPYPFFVRSQTVQRIDTFSFEGEGVLTSGDGAGVGKIFHHYVGKLEFHQRVYLYYAFDGVMGRFFFYYLRELLHRVVLAGNAKSTVDSLRRPMLMAFPIAVPSPNEQREIVEYLDGALDQLSELEQRLERSLVLLREYRQALITAAVTGQVDVTQEAA